MGKLHYTRPWDLFWVVDFPLFEPSEDGNLNYEVLQSTHHPFTAPLDEEAHIFSRDTPISHAEALKITAQVGTCNLLNKALVNSQFCSIMI